MAECYCLCYTVRLKYCELLKMKVFQMISQCLSALTTILTNRFVHVAAITPLNENQLSCCFIYCLY